MIKGPRQLEYRSDRLISGRLLLEPLNLGEVDIPAIYRPWLGSIAPKVLRPKYERFRCRKCGRVDEMACFRSGLPEDFVVPRPRPDLHVTDEYFDIWSRPLAAHICRVAASHVKLFELTGDPDYVVPWPKRLFTVPKGARIFRGNAKPRPDEAFHPRSQPCELCGRYRSTTFWSHHFRVPPDVVLAAAAIDTEDEPRMFRSLTWIAGPALAEHISKKRFKNLVLKNSFARG